VKKAQINGVILCMAPGHGNSTLTRNERRTSGEATFQRFVCQPCNGDPAHAIQAPIVDGELTSPTRYSPPERCTKHPAAKTVKAGTLKASSGVERQRYRCFPTNGDAAHRFTPVLPRLAVQHGDTCPECLAARDSNHGDTNAGRGHKYTTRVAAKALSRLAAGESYGEVAVWAKVEMKNQAHHDRPRLTFRETTKRQRTNAWRLTAD